MDEQGLKALAGGAATVDGTARNAHAGAVVMLDDRTPVYVMGLAAWDDATDGQPVTADGTLKQLHVTPDVVVEADGAVSHGIPGESWVLAGATWTVRSA